MEKNIFSKPKTIRDVFKDERYLYPDHLPERLPHRDAEIDSLVYAFTPVLKGKRPRNVFVYGGTGVGKTATVKYVLNELENFSDRGKGIYINCFEFNTRHAVLSRITNFLGYATPRRGIATDEVYTRFLGALRNADFIPLIVLDEVDQLLEHSDAEGTSKLFYDLLRVIEHQQSRIGLIFISNDNEFTSKLDARVQSSLTEDSIEFPKYTQHN
ncbi:MAG: AAA family ATPase [Candidatus Diapherotrites archaeon]